MRLVADTNTIISALVWGGTPFRLIEAAMATRVTLYTSDALIREIAGVLGRQKFSKRMSFLETSSDELISGYLDLATLVHPTQVERIVTRDPADDEVLAAALAGRADLIVSGDAHLLDLGSYRDIPVVRARDALDRIGSI